MTDNVTLPEPRSKPPGVLPKHLQQWVIGTLAVVMVMIIAFSGTNAPKEKALPAPETVVADSNAARIQEYRIRIEERLKRLAQEQERVAQAGGPSTPGTATANAVPPSFPRGPGTYGADVRPEKSWIALDREKRRYEGRYASSVALSRRDQMKPASSLAANSGVKEDQPTSPTSSDSTYRILEGTVIETVLTNRLDGTFSGPVNCLVTTPVYSEDRRRVLIPRGSRVLGKVEPVDSFGQQRLAVSFHRVILPDKTSVTLESPPGLSQVGETGLLDKVNHHYGQIFGVSLAIGAIAGLSQANTATGATASSTELYRQGVANSLSQTSLSILDRFLNVLPTFTIREGHRIKVYLTGDVFIPARRSSSLSAPGGPQ